MVVHSSLIKIIRIPNCIHRLPFRFHPYPLLDFEVSMTAKGRRKNRGKLHLKPEGYWRNPRYFVTTDRKAESQN